MTTTIDQRLDPELVPGLTRVIEAGGFDLDNLGATRAALEGVWANIKAEAPPIEGVEIEERRAPGRDGAPDVPVRLFRPAGRSGPLPALLWMHPGGWVLGNPDMDHFGVAQLAKDAGCVAASVTYRLAPEHPYPAPLEDCYAALEWLVRDARALGIDPDRIAVGGGSAGGNLAASLALLARERGGPRIAYQLLIYPALDDTNVAPASDTVPENLFWSRDNSAKGWRAYLGGRFGTADVPPTAAPFRARDLSGLPPAYIAVGELDMYLDENIEYARRLIAARVPTELHVYPRVCHAIDAFAPDAAITRRFLAEQNAALAAALRGS
ncbi:MAG TPA: alpha/beta hydrolase [Gammaproteobacteria bacterium]